MKTKFLYIFAVLLTLAGYSAATLAIEISVEDISNEVITCDSPLLVNYPLGTCLGAPDGTLFITVTLEEDDNSDILDNLHVILHSKGRYYQYQAMTGNNTEQSKLWKEVSHDKFQQKLFTASFPRLPFETRGIARQITLGKFASKPGTEVYVGVRPNYKSGFTLDAVQKVFKVQ